jgi:hypothetical protein
MAHAHPGKVDRKPETLDLKHRACMVSTELDVLCAYFSFPEIPETVAYHTENRELSPRKAIFSAAVLRRPVN